jgi:adenosylmethionine-8-amino-7-oxononanoate aminotransferase
MRTSATAKTLLLKQRQAERAYRKQARKDEIARKVAAMPPEEIKALAASAMVKIRAGLRANYHRLRPEIRRIADRLGVMNDE